MILKLLGLIVWQCLGMLSLSDLLLRRIGYACYVQHNLDSHSTGTNQLAEG